MRWMHTTVLAASILAWSSASAGAQSVSANDIQRLHDLVYDAGAELARVRTEDSQRASDLQAQLDELREEVIYLKVKLRKERTVSRLEYTSLRDRIEDVRARARNESNTSRIPEGVERSQTGTPDRPTLRPGAIPGRVDEVPVGTELDVRLQTPLDSDTAQVEDRVQATTLVNLESEEGVLIPAGSAVNGIVTSVNRATRTDRRGSLTVAFNELIINGRRHPMRATVIDAIESEGLKGEAAKIGTGAGVGAIIGGILGGFKGALAGILIGAGGTLAATEGTDVKLPAGTVLRIRIDSPVVLR
jgi:hypothetical protein